MTPFEQKAFQENRCQSETVIDYGLGCSILPKICIYLNLIAFSVRMQGFFIVVVTVLFSFSSLRKGLKSLAIRVQRLYGSVRIIVTISLSSREILLWGEGLGAAAKGSQAGPRGGKKPMRIIKCCMINERFLESFSLCLELTLQQVSGFCRMKTDSIVLSTSLQTPAQHALLPKRYCVKLNGVVNFHLFFPHPPAQTLLVSFS